MSKSSELWRREQEEKHRSEITTGEEIEDITLQESKDKEQEYYGTNH